MTVSRRMFLTGGAATAALGAAPRAFAQWQPSQRYPDPAVQIVD
jgi:gluconolactonase